MKKNTKVNPALAEAVDWAKEIIGATLVTALFALLTWLYLVATPPQFSAEHDACESERIQLEGGAK